MDLWHLQSGKDLSCGSNGSIQIRFLMGVGHKHGLKLGRGQIDASFQHTGKVGGMLNRGIYLAPAQFEAMFVSYAHKKADLDAALTAAREVFATL